MSPPSLRRPRATLALALLSLAALFLPAALAQVVDSNDSPDKAPAKANTVDTAAAFARADADHDGLLDAREFAAFTDSIKQALDPFLGGAYNAPPPQYDAYNGNLNAPARGKLRGGAAGVNKFWSGFVSGILTIWATEIGDKTFFIAAILSMKKDRVVVFAGAIGALIVMTVLSVVMGVVATKFLPPSLTHYVGAILVRTVRIWDGGGMKVLTISIIASSSSCSASRCCGTRARCRAGPSHFVVDRVWQ